MRRRRPRPSSENVFATLAVFLALGGGSVAIAGIPARDSVDSASVVDESLESRDLRDGAAVTGADVVDGSLGAVDLDTGAVAGEEIAADAVGATEIADGAVGAREIAEHAVGASEVASDAIGSAELLPASVGSVATLDEALTGSDIGPALDGSEITGVYRSESDGVTFEDVDSARNGDYGYGVETGDCLRDRVGTGELIYGYGRWSDDGNPAFGNELVISEVRLNMETDTVTVIGGSDDGSQGGDSFHTLHAVAVCLAL